MRRMLMACLFLSVSSSAQIMVIHRSDGSTQRIPVADIARITFDLSAGATQTARRTGTATKMKAVLANILPNPFSTRIEYFTTNESHVRVSVFDVQGKAVRTILDSKVNVGSHATQWDARDDGGRGVTAGPYLIRVEVNGAVYSKSLFIVR